MALTVAIMSLALMITLGGVALNEAIDALRQSTRQTNVKKALQAADAGIESAAYAVARADISGTLKIDPLNPGNGVTQNCVVTVGGVAGIDVTALNLTSPTDPQGQRWCPETATETTEGGATFTYRLSQLARVNSTSCGGPGAALSLERWVVAVGRSKGQLRRVKARLRAPLALLSGAAVQASSADVPLTMSGSVSVTGNVTSNADINGTPGQSIVGSAIPGPGKSVNSPGPTVSGTKSRACAKFSIPEVNQGAAPASNDNATVRSDCYDQLLVLNISSCGSGTSPLAGKVDFNAAARTLHVGANGRVTLQSGTYSFCSIVLDGHGVLEVANGATVRIFLDDPANCRASDGSYLPGAGTIRMSQASRIVNCNPDTSPQSLQLYAVGNPNIATTQILSSGGNLSAAQRTLLCGLSLPAVAGEPMLVVAPYSRVEMGGTYAISGQVAAEEVRMAGNASVRSVNALANLDQLGEAPVLPLYKAQEYQECTGRTFADLPAADPSQGC